VSVPETPLDPQSLLALFRAADLGCAGSCSGVSVLEAESYGVSNAL
jgi:hypothetical protein